MFFLEKWRAHKRRTRLEQSLETLYNKRRTLTIKQIEVLLSGIDVFALAETYTPARGRIEAEFYYTPSDLLSAMDVVYIAVSEDTVVGNHVLPKQTKSQYFEEWFTEAGYYMHLKPYLTQLVPKLGKLAFAMDGADLTRPDRSSYYGRMCKPLCNDLVILTTLLYQMELGYV